LPKAPSGKGLQNFRKEGVVGKKEKKKKKKVSNELKISSASF